MNKLLSVNGLEFTYRSQFDPDQWRLLVSEFSINANSLYILRGNNMSGKSTFLNVLAGIQKMPEKDRNCIVVGRGSTSRPQDLIDNALLISNDDKMFPDLSIWDNVRISLPRLNRREENTLKHRCKEFLESSQIFGDKSLKEPLADLSTGGKSMVQLSRVRFSPKPVILIDELTSYLDDERSRFFLDTAADNVCDASSVLIVSHNQRDREYLHELGKRRSLPVFNISVDRTENVSAIVSS